MSPLFTRRCEWVEGKLGPFDPRRAVCSMLMVNHLTGFGSGGLPVIAVVISSSTNNVNIRTLAGSPSYPADIRVTVNSGVTIGSSSTSTPSMDWGTSWPAGSKFSLTNLGTIEGRGGNGGAGGPDTAPGSGTSSGSPGGSGGPAMDARGLTITINNTSGNIWGGGNGGTGGNGRGINGNKGDYGDVGSGGGGGAGSPPGGGGSPDGAGGTTTAGGVGGSSTTGGAGSNGGGPGDAKAINLNSGSVTFTGGGTAPNVKGAVS